MASRRAPLLVLLYAVAAAAVVQLDLPPVVATFLVAPLVLATPGLALVMALRLASHPELPWRIFSLSIALSIATTALGGLFVNAVTSLTAASWTVWMVGFTAICCVVALLRADPAPAAGLSLRPVPWTRASAMLVGRWRLIATGTLVTLLFAGAAALTEVSSRSAYNVPIMQLSLATSPSSGSGEVQLSVTNLTGHFQRLQLKIVRGRGPGTISLAGVPASGTWTANEQLGSSGISVVLSRPGQTVPIDEVTWRPTPATVPRAIRELGGRAGCASSVLETLKPAILRAASPARPPRVRATRRCSRPPRKRTRAHRYTHPRRRARRARTRHPGTARKSVVPARG
jgi:hypothetical protein